MNAQKVIEMDGKGKSSPPQEEKARKTWGGRRTYKVPRNDIDS